MAKDLKIIIEEISSPRLRLEVRDEKHVAEIFDLLQDKDLYLYITREVPRSQNDLVQGIRRVSSFCSPDKKELWAGWIAKNKATNKPIGIFELTLIAGDAFLAYSIFKEDWNKGYAVEGVKAMMEFALKYYKVERFIIEMDTRNYASIRVAQKLGFHFNRVSNNVCMVKGEVSHEFQFTLTNLT